MSPGRSAPVGRGLDVLGDFDDPAARLIHGDLSVADPMQWEKGIPYFVRDFKTEQLETLLETTGKKRKERIARLVAELNVLNSKIKAHENQRLLPLDVVRT